MRILLVEDTEDLAEAIADHFRASGHALDRAAAVAEALAYLRAADGFAYDLVLLDVALPDGSGAEVLARLRRDGSGVPVVVLTARSEIADRVQLLDLGADDYVTKPFHFDELDARCRAVLRRRAGKPDNTVRLGQLEFDAGLGAAWIAGEPMRLRTRELRLLEIFLSSPRQIHSKAGLLERMFGLAEEPSENAIEVYVGRLRRKLDGSGVAIETVRGAGYRLVES